MIEVVTTDANPAASSAAPRDPSDALASASPEALNTWRMTGELPTSEPSSPPADSTPAEPDAQAASTEALSPPASEAGRDPGKRSDPRATENRVPELLAERAKAREEAAAERARADRLERELQALRAPTPPADAKAPASSAAPASDPEPDPDDASKYPDGAYDRKYFKDQAAWEARQVLRVERETAAHAAREHQQTERARQIAQSWAERVEAARAKLPDFDAKAFGATEIAQGSPIDVWIMESPQGAELLYHLQANPAEIRRIAALPAVQQVRELVQLEGKLVPAPAKTITDAPDPPRTLGDRSTSSADAVERALANKDVGSYIEAANRRDLAARSR